MIRFSKTIDLQVLVSGMLNNGQLKATFIMKFEHLKTSSVKNSRWFVLKSLSVLNYSIKIYVLLLFPSGNVLPC